MERWPFCFNRLLPKEEIVYFAQVIISYIIIIAGLLNLTFGVDVNTSLWMTLISGITGYLLPNPSLHHRHQDVAVLHESSEQRESENLSEEHSDELYDASA